jgi:UDP-N-acetylglucosamine--N-acetylmuramyl-(pentapeptide) pyrophosphoryl-undecaprenol N-acetylglucosamine transferase
MSKVSLKICLIGGGTGGHLFPAIATAQELERQNIKTFLITDKRCEKYLPDSMSIKTFIFTLGSMSAPLMQKLLTLARMSVATLLSIKILLQEKPMLVVGFGGYPTLPTLLAARILKIPIALHEQNCFLGKVNKIFAKSALLIALNFKQTQNIDANLQGEIIVTGNPIRQEIAECKFEKNFEEEPFTVLVIGGSQGALYFNDLMIQAIILLKKQTSKEIKIIQQAPLAFHQQMQKSYFDIGIQVEISDFFLDICLQYNKAHLVIARSGASTISELINAGLPAILVPLPTSAQNHQLYNAQVLSDAKASWYFEQKNLNPKILADQVLKLMMQPSILQEARNNLLNMKKDAAKIFASSLVKKIKKASLDK